MAQVIPLTYYTKNHWIPLAPPVTTTIAPHTVRTMEIPPYISNMNGFGMFHRDHSSKAMSELYKYLSHHHRPYKVKHGGKKESWLDYFNPFSCDTDYEDEGYDGLEEDDDDYSDSGESMFRRRKFKRTHKHKLSKKKKSKKKKKKILIKFVIGFLAFIAIKFLFEKLWYIFPTIFPTTARDEFINEVDMLLEEGIELDRDTEWRKARAFAAESRALFAPKYEETRIDLTIPMRPRIFTNF